MTKQLLSEIAAEALAFVSSRKSLQLATSDTTGTPLASYAPFYRMENSNFYIYISSLAAHSKNLTNSKVSILIIADETDTQQIYTRERVCFRCHSSAVTSDKEEYKLALQGLRNKHGEIIETLAQLSDFTLYRLKPESGHYIRNFGQAYDINTELTTAIPVLP